MTLGEVIDAELIRDISKKLISNEQISNPDISIESGSNIGEGYASVNCVVNIKSAQKSLSVFLKISPKDINLRKTTGTSQHFPREINFYKRILPVLGNICTHFQFNVAPKCYDTSSKDCNEYLVLDNLKCKGFILKPNGILFEHDHALLVFQKLAAFHAASHVLKDQNMEVFEDLAKDVPNLWYDLFERYNHFTNVRQYINQIQGHLDPTKDQNIIEILEKIPEEFAEMITTLDGNIDQYSVFVHADVWINNILFSYNEQKKPIDVRLVDFQMSMLNTPVLDLAQFFYTCCFSEEQLNNIDFYLDYYYDCLSDNIKSLGSDPKLLYPYEIFKLEWTKSCRFGLYMAIGIFRILLAGKTAAEGFVDAMKKSDNSIHILPVSFKENEMCAEYVIRIVRHMMERNYRI